MSNPRPLIALVGRPNVGKSTLFNRLAGRRVAIVQDVPGVTRDRNYADVVWDDRALSIVDTGGFEPETRDRLLSQVRQQAQLAVEEAAAIVLVVDGREGVTNVDRAIANLLRRSGKPLFVAVNKVDTAATEADIPLAEFYALGFQEVHAVSAEHARGVAGLLEAILEKLALPPAPPPPRRRRSRRRSPRTRGRAGTCGSRWSAARTSGRAPFVNALLREERFVVSDIPGTTRDAID